VDFEILGYRITKALILLQLRIPEMIWLSGFQNQELGIKPWTGRLERRISRLRHCVIFSRKLGGLVQCWVVGVDDAFFGKSNIREVMLRYY